MMAGGDNPAFVADPGLTSDPPLQEYQTKGAVVTTNASEMVRQVSRVQPQQPLEEACAMVISEQPHMPVSNFREGLPQVLAISAKNLLLLSYGMTLGFPTILIPALLRDAEQGLILSPEQISWLGSINLICVPLGCLGSGILTTHLGRKRSMLLVNLPLVAAWLILHLAASPAALLAALSLTGFTGGLLEAPVLTYVAEVTTPKLRGVLSSTSSMCVILGVNSQLIFGTMMGWRSVAAVNLAAPILAFLALLMVPESPYWLASKQRMAEARSSLAWLRGWVPESVVEREFAELQDTVSAPQGDDSSDSSSRVMSRRQRLRQHLKAYRRATFIKPFLLVSGAFFFGHFSGMTTLQTYAVIIFEQLGAPIDPYIATMVMGLVGLGGTLLCVICVHWTGKRPLTLISTLGSAISFGVVATYAQLRTPTTDENLAWLPLSMIFSAALLINMGIRLLPWILIGEVFPPEVRGMASGLTSSVGYIFGFLANKTHLSLVAALTLPGTFWVYVLVSSTATLVLYLTLPETEGRTLLEINMHFAGIRQAGWKKRQRKTKAMKNTSEQELGENIANKTVTGSIGAASDATDNKFDNELKTDVRNNNAGSINEDM